MREELANREITGHCLCGQVRYRARRAPERVGHCHCDMCRRASGAIAFTLAVFERYDVQWEGNLKHYRSSDAASRGFCAECGSPMTYEPHGRPGKILISVGSLDEPDRVPAEFSIFTSEQIPWLKLDQHLAQFHGWYEPNSSAATSESCRRCSRSRC